MSNTSNETTDAGQPRMYQIRLEGHLSPEWTDWFECLTLTLEDNGQSLLTCSVVDQTALYGLLRKVRDAGLALVSIIHVEPKQTDEPNVKP